MFRGKLKDLHTLDAVIPKKQNIFENNELYFQKCKDLEEQVSYLRSLNQFLVSQILQNFSSKFQPQTQKGELSHAIRKKSAQFDDDKSLNKTFQLFKIFKGLLDDGNQALKKISSTFFPSNFDFETALLSKNYQTIINLLLKSAINSTVSLKEGLIIQEEENYNKDLGGIRAKIFAPEGKGHQRLIPKHSTLRNKVVDNTTLLLKGAQDLIADDKSFLSGEERKLGTGYAGYGKGATLLSRFMIEDKSPYEPKWQGSLSDGLSMSQHKMTDGPMLSDSFLNATEIRNHFLRPFELDPPQPPAPIMIDQAVQVSLIVFEDKEKHADTSSFYQPDSGGNGNDSLDQFTPI
jgi:hypothetical protein